MTCLQRIASKSNPVPCFQAKWLLLRPLLFPQMVKLCWAHGLYDAIFYVYNRGMRDYTTPLEVFLDVHYLSPGGWGSKDFGYVTIKVTWSSLRLCGIWMILLSGSQFSIVPCLYSETTDFPPLMSGPLGYLAFRKPCKVSLVFTSVVVVFHVYAVKCPACSDVSGKTRKLLQFLNLWEWLASHFSQHYQP